MDRTWAIAFPPPPAGEEGGVKFPLIELFSILSFVYLEYLSSIRLRFSGFLWARCYDLFGLPIQGY